MLELPKEMEDEIRRIIKEESYLGFEDENEFLRSAVRDKFLLYWKLKATKKC